MDVVSDLLRTPVISASSGGRFTGLKNPFGGTMCTEPVSILPDLPELPGSITVHSPRSPIRSPLSALSPNTVRMRSASEPNVPRQKAARGGLRDATPRSPLKRNATESPYKLPSKTRKRSTDLDASPSSTDSKLTESSVSAKGSAGKARSGADKRSRFKPAPLSLDRKKKDGADPKHSEVSACIHIFTTSGGEGGVR